MLDKLNDHKMMPDWLDFYEVAVKAGWHPERTVHKLSEAVGDVYGPDFRVGWETRFKALIAGRGG